jgi:hypothetical protein
MTTLELRTPVTLPPDTTTELAATGTAIDPYPTFHRLREAYPVAEFAGTVSLFRYDDVAALLRHPQVSTDDRNSTMHQTLVAQDKLAPAYLSQVDDQSFLHRDPPEHTRLRKLVAQGFTARRVAALRSFVQRTVDDALDTAEGRLELVGELAYPLPIEVICELLGIPAEDRPFVASWPRLQLCCTFENASLAAAQKADSSERIEADRLQQQLTDYFALLIERRRDTPGDDLISALLAAEEHNGRLTVEEINATLRLLFVAGYENAVNLIGHGVLALLRHPDQWAALGTDPTLAAGAVDEALRYDAPFQFTRRVTQADLDIGGYRIRAGQHVLAWLAAANRDPARFPDPDRFDIRRHGNHHLAFGSGIHACLGGPLARMEAEIVFTTLTRRLVQPRLESDPPTYRTDVFRSLTELPITISGVRERA